MKNALYVMLFFTVLTLLATDRIVAYALGFTGRMQLPFMVAYDVIVVASYAALVLIVFPFFVARAERRQ